MDQLPSGYVLRALTTEDLPSAQALLDDCETVDTGAPSLHHLALAVETHRPDFDIERAAWAIDAPDGGLAGVGWVRTPGERRISLGDFYVRPGLRTLPLDEVFLDLIEERFAQLAHELGRAGHSQSPVRLLTFNEPVLDGRRRLLLSRGFAIVRQTFQMRLDFGGGLGGPPGPARLPGGIVVCPARLGEDDRLLYAADEEAFSEHFGYQESSFEEWSVETVRHELLDPGLWLVAWDGSEVAGQALALPREGEARINSLSVRKPWRGRGLGQALLQAMFQVLADRGYPFVRLFVDSQNETGAVDLYLKVGMREERRFEAFEKTFV